MNSGAGLPHVASTRRIFRRTALLCATVAFLVASLLALAAADLPPPAGFAWLEILLAALAAMVYRRVFSRLAARAQGRRIPAAALEGILAALALGLALLVFSPGEPGVTPTAGDRLVWFAVLGLVGGVIAQSFWGLAVLVTPTPGGSDRNASQ